MSHVMGAFRASPSWSAALPTVAGTAVRSPRSFVSVWLEVAVLQSLQSAFITDDDHRATAVAGSFPNAFPPTKSPWRVCDQLYRFQGPVSGGGRTQLYLMALQPSKRGAWCRADRKKSYRPGDISLLVARLDQGSLAVVGGGLSGSRPSHPQPAATHTHERTLQCLLHFFVTCHALC